MAGDVHRRRCPRFRDDRVEPATDAKTHQSLDNPNPRGRGFIADQRPKRPPDEESDKQTHDAVGQKAVRKPGRLCESERAVPDRATDYRALEKSDEQLDHDSSMTVPGLVGKADRLRDYSAFAISSPEGCRSV